MFLFFLSLCTRFRTCNPRGLCPELGNCLREKGKALLLTQEEEPGRRWPGRCRPAPASESHHSPQKGGQSLEPHTALPSGQPRAPPGSWPCSCQGWERREGWDPGKPCPSGGSVPTLEIGAQRVGGRQRCGQHVVARGQPCPALSRAAPEGGLAPRGPRALAAHPYEQE